MKDNKCVWTDVGSVEDTKAIALRGHSMRTELHVYVRSYALDLQYIRGSGIS